jgi:hypothetical protein
MNFDFFDESKPAYIAVNTNGFHLNGKLYQKLECFIREITPVRKLFKGKKIECYSNDAKKGKSGETCALCSKRMNCRQRIRLMLLVHDKGNESSVPAQLEINSNSFEPLKKMLEPIEKDDLSNLLVVLEVKKQDKYLQIQFNPVF